MRRKILVARYLKTYLFDTIYSLYPFTWSRRNSTGKNLLAPPYRKLTGTSTLFSGTETNTISTESGIKSFPLSFRSIFPQVFNTISSWFPYSVRYFNQIDLNGSLSFSTLSLLIFRLDSLFHYTKMIMK